MSLFVLAVFFTLGNLAAFAPLALPLKAAWWPPISPLTSSDITFCKTLSLQLLTPQV